MHTYSAPIRQTIDTDVLVVGSGSAGSVAALAAAETGAQTMLVERYGFMGGISTQVLDTFYGFYTPGTPKRKVIGGLPDVVVGELMWRGVALIRPNTYGAGNGVTYDAEVLKMVWETLALERGVRLLYHTFVLDATTDGDRITGVIAANKQGLLHIRAKAVVDASGDADVAAAAGAPFEGPKDGPVQALTTTFRMINVDTDRARQVKKTKLHDLMADAIAQGYNLPRKEGSVHITPFDGVMHTNMTRVGNIDGTDAHQLTAAEVEGRRQAAEYARFLVDFVPGYEQSVLADLSNQIGIRESRRLYGDYRLSRADVLQARTFDDAIAQCGAPIEEHHSGGDTRWEYVPEGQTYGLPLRCLLPQKVEGLLVAGRCLSADHDAHASARSMGQCMAMGQAAGTVAALAVAQNTLPREVRFTDVHDTLRATGAMLSPDHTELADV
ncbi:MAG: FAD-dependent oxidoreductase [Rhodothermales bacterium]